MRGHREKTVVPNPSSEASGGTTPAGTLTLGFWLPDCEEPISVAQRQSVQLRSSSCSKLRPQVRLGRKVGCPPGREVCLTEDEAAGTWQR